MRSHVAFLLRFLLNTKEKNIISVVSITISPFSSSTDVFVNVHKQHKEAYEHFFNFTEKTAMN